MVEKVKDLIAFDAKFTIRYIAKCVGISVGASHTMLRLDLQNEKGKCHMDTPSA
jgi:hypothetical protein